MASNKAVRKPILLIENSERDMEITLQALKNAHISNAILAVKNGDQALPLFQEDADIFFVQHWREIDPSVVSLIQKLAIARSISTGNTIFYGVIDGQDSERLRAAYSSKFQMKKSKKSSKRAKKR